MKGEKVSFDAAAAAKTNGRTNERSETPFPYLDLDAAVTVAKAVYARAGISSCPLDELAAQMNVTTSGGSFRLKTSAARMFGFVEKDGQSALKLTDLGCRLVSPESETEAKVAAFLQVPLYNQIYEKYRGKLLPPTKALEREMQTMGVALTLTDKARHAFQRSARQAGYFNSGEDRLVRPRSAGGPATPAETLDQVAADKPAPEQEQDHRRNGGGGGSGGGGGGAYHPFIQGLLQTLPEPGTLWTVEGRAAWLQAAAQNFTLIYKGEGKIDVHAVVASHKDKAA